MGLNGLKRGEGQYSKSAPTGGSSVGDQYTRAQDWGWTGGRGIKLLARTWSVWTLERWTLLLPGNGVEERKRLRRRVDEPLEPAAAAPGETEVVVVKLVSV